MRTNTRAGLQGCPKGNSEPGTGDADSRTDVLDGRTRRALEQHLTVTPDVGRVRGADGLVLVTSESGREYLVDLNTARCQRQDGARCPDQKYNLPDGEPCKHVVRGRIATGRRPITTAEVQAADVVPDLGAHADGPIVVSTDGGIVEAPDDGIVLEDDGPTYTYHREPERQGGARYVRCERCGREVIGGDPDRLLHAEGCPEGDRR